MRRAAQLYILSLIGVAVGLALTLGAAMAGHQPAMALSGAMFLTIAGGSGGATLLFLGRYGHRQRQRELAQMKNDFVSMVSHELRTPLASIRAYVELLIDGEARGPAMQREFYEVIQSEANRLGRLIDNVLTISRIEAGLVRVQKQPHSLCGIARDAIEAIAPQATQKGIAFEQDLAAEKVNVNADRDMLYQALLNLLANAVKYTPPGGKVTVRVAVDARHRKLITRITDTGVGISPKDIPFVFDKFFRAEASSRMAPGTGLGLSLVKYIIETVHQGRVFLESQVGKGSCFGFDFDLCS